MGILNNLGDQTSDSDVQSTKEDEDNYRIVMFNHSRIGQVLSGIYNLSIPIIAGVGLYLYYKRRV
jgi:hypothetical protein